MKREEIIKLAEKAGMFVHKEVQPELIAFADLVATQEREACEMAVEEIARKYQKAHEASAENVADACAYAIRARGTT